MNVQCFPSAQACEHGNEDKQAFSLFEEMPAAGVIPDEYTFSNLIMVCKKDSEKALLLMRSMEQTGLKPGSVAYNAAIVACGNGDQPDQAMALLNEMRERGVQVTEGTYSAAIAANGKAHRWEQALSLLEDMKDGKDNLEPNEYCYHACISGKFYSFSARVFLSLSSRFINSSPRGHGVLRSG